MEAAKTAERRKSSQFFGPDFDCPLRVRSGPLADVRFAPKAVIHESSSGQAVPVLLASGILWSELVYPDHFT